MRQICRKHKQAITRAAEVAFHFSCSENMIFLGEDWFSFRYQILESSRSFFLQESLIEAPVFILDIEKLI